MAVFHVIYEHIDILYLEAVVPMFICITKMLTYCVYFTMLYLYIVLFIYGLWPEHKTTHNTRLEMERAKRDDVVY